MMEVDPFFAVKREVEKTIDTVNGLHSQWLLARSSPGSRDEFLRLGDELRNNLKNVEWDLEDLEEAIRVSEKNPARFSLDGSEIDSRKKFVSNTRSITEKIKQNMETPDATRHSEPKSLKPLMNKFVPGLAHKVSYTRLASDDPENLFEDTVNKQKMIIKSQDEQLSTIGTSVQALKNMSNQIGLELDEQSVMLDEFAHEMDTTDTKLDGVMKKMAKVLHMSNDRRQWIAIGVLLLILIIVIILFMIL